jgi:ketosteroid isomerase-like protein
MPTNEPEAASEAYRRLAALYAQAADRGTAEAMATLFAEDSVIVTPDATLQGSASISRIPAMLRDMFAATRHEILQQTIVPQGNNAWCGETYCNALHLLRAAGEGPRQVLVWAIRYQDEFRFADGDWRFARRELVLDWKELRTVTF